MASKQLTKSRRWLNLAKARFTACWSALTSEFNYSKDYFFGWTYLLAFAGVRLDSDNAKIRRWWNLYRVLSAAPFFVVGMNATMNIVRRENLEVVAVGVQIVITIIVALLRIGIINRSYASLRTIREYVNKRQFGRNLDSSLRIRGQAFYRMRKIVVACGLILLSVLLSCFLIDVSHHALAMPLFARSRIVKGLEKLVGSLAFGGISMFIFAAITVYMILAGLHCELELIAESFGTVLDRANNRTQRELEATPGNSEQLLHETKRYFWKYVQEEFDDCIQLHQEFLSKLELIRPFLNATFLVIYCSSAACIACGAFFILYTKTISLMVVHSWFFAGMLLMECCTFTRAVSLLTEVNESIGEQVYNLDWSTQLEFEQEFADEYRSVRQTMLLVMTMSQQPLRINCFGFFEFTQDKFTELIMMSYDLVSFLKHFV